MCNLYNLTTTQQAVLEWTRALRDISGNWRPSMTVGPDRHGPIVRNGLDGKRELVKRALGNAVIPLCNLAGHRGPRDEDAGQGKDRQQGRIQGVDEGRARRGHNQCAHGSRANIGRSGTIFRTECVVPITSFAEWDKENRRNQWFSVTEERPLAFFAGLWVPQHTSIRKKTEGPVTIDVYGFLTTEPNNVVKPIHFKAMPVLLTTQEETETWLTAPWDEAKKLQRSLPDSMTALVDAPKDAISVQ